MSSIVPLIESPTETVEHLRNIIDSEDVRAFIDLGCGRGQLVIGVSSGEVYGVGIDISEKLIYEAKRASKSNGKYGYTDFIVADFYNLPFRRGLNVAFYMYLYGSIIESLKEEILKCLGENGVVISLDFPVKYLEIDGVKFMISGGILRFLFKYKRG